ncbi:hypothetical protein EW145_g6487 [Phellinidium pouzarii]|uniref:SH3 domain-containing protein n=1 Tax=Phellinidium pouzarii TaxID=167371 RepID=A0A4V6S135_9AGAM|nr:hypothetical protein EW145_g6487 [Phellinidium pouzarii]
MASKQLGKLRQWAGEVISSREKTQPSSEFMAIEKDIEVMKGGIEKLHVASTDYLEYISRTAQSEAVVSNDLMMSTEALGVVMIGYGENLGDGGALGRSLSMFGRARCRIAAMQNIYAVTFADTFLMHLTRSISEFEDYAVRRKKLESRRLAYDAAISKAEKAFKKEKDKKEAEDELQKARLRYEEMSDEMRECMDAIRDREAVHQRQLRNFLDLERNFVEQYLETLKEVQLEWPEADYSPNQKSGSAFVSPHTFSRISTRSSDSKDSSDVKQAPPIPSRFGARRSNHSLQSTDSNGKKVAVGEHENETSSVSDEEMTASRPFSQLSRKTSAKSSRPSSRQSKVRSRSGSVTTTASTVAANMIDDTTSVKSNGKHKKTASGVASWVGDAMTSVMGRNKSRISDKENFSALGDETEDEDLADNDNANERRSRRLSNHSTKSAEKKLMKALYDFSGSSDELSFRAGDEIIVLHEVLDDWWLGEAGGRKGLFPTNYAVMVKTNSTASRSKNASSSSIIGLSQLTRTNKLSLEERESRRTLVDASDTDFSTGEDENDGESVTEWRPYVDVSDHGAAADIPNHRTDYGVGDTEFQKKLSVSLGKLDLQGLSSNPVESTGRPIEISTYSPNGSPVKRMPPPPPPKRRMSVAKPSGPPPLPMRNLAIGRTQSTSSVPNALVPPAMKSRHAHSESSSPFESQSELSFDAVATTYTPSSCGACGCTDFIEDPFRLGGQHLCANICMVYFYIL